LRSVIANTVGRHGPRRIQAKIDREGGTLTQELEKGDRVEWNTPQGKTNGKVKKKLTSRTEVGNQTIAASEDDPRYLIESEKSGKEAAHRPEALTKL